MEEINGPTMAMAFSCNGRWTKMVGENHWGTKRPVKLSQKIIGEIQETKKQKNNPTKNNQTNM